MSLLLLLAAALIVAPPETPRKPVTTAYHGVKITDDYRWLEDGEDPAVKSWSDAQNTAARAYLDSVPSRARLTFDGSHDFHLDAQPRGCDSLLFRRRGVHRESNGT